MPVSISQPSKQPKSSRSNPIPTPTDGKATTASTFHKGMHKLQLGCKVQTRRSMLLERHAWVNQSLPIQPILFCPYISTG
uniref:Uncharacterized protein n=1 Tax=Zea mays TaxID=4577 RepID=C0P494_MAIZE|nr:unknown [Zea mays]